MGRWPGNAAGRRPSHNAPAPRADSVITTQVDIAATRATHGDVILVNGYIGDHGAAVLDTRAELALESSIETDCQPLNGLVQTMLNV